MAAAKVRASAPASCANLSSGFDVFGIALEHPRDEVSVALRTGSSPSTSHIRIIAKGDFRVPSAPEENAAGAVALAMTREHGIRHPIEITLLKMVRPGVGLGSSAASSAGAALAMNEFFRLGLGVRELIRFASLGEKVASGTAHFDNVTASIVGGFAVSAFGGKGAPVSFDPPPHLRACLVTPSLELPSKKTEFARSLLPRSVPLSAMTHNIAMASSLVAGFAKSDIGLIGRGMEDLVVEPARRKMIPGYDVVRESAMASGAVGVGISGAGPTMLAFVDSSKASATAVLTAMKAGFTSSGVRADGFVTRIGKGARILHG